MAKIRYQAKENDRFGVHSVYASAIPTGKLSFAELCEEACEDNTYGVEEMTGCVSKFMKIVQREALRGWRCQLGSDFLTIYPVLEASIKDYKDKKTGETVVVTPAMLTANNAKSRLGCTVSAKFSSKFASEVSWQKVDAQGNDVTEEEDITQNNDGPSGDDGNQNGGGEQGGGSDSPATGGGDSGEN